MLVPTRELALQVADELEKLAPSQGPPRGRRSTAARRSHKQAKAAKGAQIVVATPGRLQDLMDRRLIAVEDVAILVLDEADRMLDMGFRPQVEKILRRLPRKRQTMLFSATLDGEVGELARAYTRNPSRFEAEQPVPEDGDAVDGAHLRLGHERRQARPPDRAARGRPRARARLRPHQARRRPPRREAAAPRRRRPSRCTAT